MNAQNLAKYGRGTFELQGLKQITKQIKKTLRLISAFRSQPWKLYYFLKYAYCASQAKEMAKRF